MICRILPGQPQFNFGFVPSTLFSASNQKTCHVAIANKLPELMRTACRCRRCEG